MEKNLLANLPLEIYVDHLLPSMQVPDILNLGLTNKFFYAISSDDTFWQRRLQTDFNFSGTGTARTSGWKFIYRGIFKPRVYVWGEKSHSRLGLLNFPKTNVRGLPFPVELRIPGIRVVSLVAGGMSFHALDSEGHIHVWGTLNGATSTLGNDGFSEPGKTARTPLRLQMPTPMRSISCGRLHASSLDSKGQIWTFPNWGRPFKLVSDFFTVPISKPLQIECGWGFSSVLTASGEVFVWWPFSGEMEERIQAANMQMDREGGKKASALPDYSIPCVTWDLDENPTRLPSLPSLPELPSEDNEEKPTQLIQIAGLDAQIIGLTNKGHVLKIGNLETKQTSSAGRWEYLPEFSKIDNVQARFSRLGIDSPETLKITHISANFVNFIAYSTVSSSVVLIGDTETTLVSPPKIIPELQHRSIISVVLGDYHNAALTANGKVLTWGAYSEGALGLGDPTTLAIGTPGGYNVEADRDRALSGRMLEPPAVVVPTEVRFDHGLKSPKDRFCFSIAAAGWHTGALVMDLEPGEEEEKVEFDSQPEGRPLPRRMYEQPHVLPGVSPPFNPFPGVRIGFAGRGSAFGRGWGRGSG